jgi:hypothetical protein
MDYLPELCFDVPLPAMIKIDLLNNLTKKGNNDDKSEART